MEVRVITQMTVIEPMTNELADQLLAEDGDVVANRAKDVVSKVFLNSFREATMRMSSIRTVANAQIDTNPISAARIRSLLRRYAKTR